MAVSKADAKRCVVWFGQPSATERMTSLQDPITDVDRYVATAYANDRAHVFHSWSAQGALDPTVIVGAQGSRMPETDKV